MFTRLCLFRKLVISKRDLILSEACLSWLNINFNQSEPYIIQQYLNEGTKYLNEHIAQQLSTWGFVVKFGGVFVHQNPIINRLSECKGNKRCELGDLLTVFLFVDKNKNLLFQSAFISQAKKRIKWIINVKYAFTNLIKNSNFREIYVEMYQILL